MFASAGFRECRLAGDGVERAGFRLGYAETERGERFGLRFADVRKRAFDLARQVVQ